MKLRKILAMLAVICLLATTIPAFGVAAEEASPRFSELLVQFIGRMPSNDPKNGLHVSLSSDGVTWTNPVDFQGHGQDVWGCTNEVTGSYFASVACTADQLAAITGNKLYVKVGMSAGDVSHVVLHQLRIAGTYTGESAQTEFVWDNFSAQAAHEKNGYNGTNGSADIIEKVPGIVDANNVWFQSCSVGHEAASGISPCYGGYYGAPENVNAYVTYAFDLKAPDTNVYFDFEGRVPDAASVKLSVGSSLDSLTEAATANFSNTSDPHNAYQTSHTAITDKVDLNAYKLYVRLDMATPDVTWLSMRKVKIYVGNKALLDLDYDAMAVNSEDYKATAGYLDSANVRLVNSYDAGSGEPSGLGASVTSGAYIVYEIQLADCEHAYDNDCDADCNACGDTREAPHAYDGVCDAECNGCGATREAPHAYDDKKDLECNLCGATRNKFDSLFVMFLGRLPSNDPKNCIYIHLSSDGETWTDPVEYQGHGMNVYGCNHDLSNSTYLATINLTDQQIATLTGDQLYVKIGFASGYSDQCVIHQLLIGGYYPGETEQTIFAYDIFNDLPAHDVSALSVEETSADIVSKVSGIVDANNAVLYSCNVDHAGITGLSVYEPGYYNNPDANDGAGEYKNAYVTYHFNLCEHEYFYACDPYCSKCYELTNPDAAHSITHVEAKAATCTENGNIEYWTCEHCNGCWDNANGIGMPLNKMMVTVWAGHSYDDDQDTTCNACGETRVIEYDVISFGGNSISEDISGLAFKFDVNVKGLTVNGTTAIYDNATVTPDSTGTYKLVEMGAVVSNDMTVDWNLDTVNGSTVIKVPAKYLCDLDEENGTASFAVRVTNIPETAYDASIVAVPYFIYEDAEGNQVVRYGYENFATYNSALEG